MKKKDSLSQQHAEDMWLEHSSDSGVSAEKDKLSRKQKLMKLFLTSDLKNTKLWKPLQSVKESMIKNFHDWGFDSSDVDKLFRIYFNEHKDVFIPKHLKGRITHFKVFVSQMPNNTKLALHEYLYVLRNIRKQINDFMIAIEPLKKTAHDYADLEMKETLEDDIYTDFDRDATQQQHRALAKAKFSDLMQASSDVSYDRDRFQQEMSILPDTRRLNNYKDITVFALLGFHYFDKKNLVYSIFSDQQLEEELVFDLPKYQPDKVSLTLEEYLHLIEKIDFKNKVFSF